ncbi:MAG: DUF2971 domain-containing protein [Chitinophagales bacterium]
MALKIKELGDPLSNNAILWRYFDFQKFLSFIIDQALFFNRMDKMEDINEGISMNQLIMKYGSDVEKQIVLKEKERNSRKELNLKLRQQKYFLSCWLIHHRESVAMWNSYSDNDGIAIKINGHQLINSVKSNSTNPENSDKMKSLYFGRVVYKDFFHEADRSQFKEEIEIIGFQKDICFEYEREYRFLFKQDLHKYKSHDISHLNLRLSDYKKLNFELVFHPKMESWKKDNIKKVLELLKVKNIKPIDSELQLQNWGN